MINFIIFIMAFIFLIVLWVGRGLNFPWVYRIGIPIDEVELPIEALEVRDPLDVRFYVIPKKGYLAIKEGHFWYPSDNSLNKTFGLNRNRVFFQRVFGTVERTFGNKAILRTFGWSPVSFIFGLGLAMIYPMVFREFLAEPGVEGLLVNVFPLLLITIISVFSLKMTYDESKILSGIVVTRFRFALQKDWIRN